MRIIVLCALGLVLPSTPFAADKNLHETCFLAVLFAQGGTVAVTLENEGKHAEDVTVQRSLVSGKVLCGGQQTLSIQCRGGNLSGKRFERRAAENWAGAPLPRFSTMRDAHRPVRFLRVDRPSPSPGVSEMRGPL